MGTPEFAGILDTIKKNHEVVGITAADKPAGRTEIKIFSCKRALANNLPYYNL
jgi:methionyl-tRNA formyltransferase